MPTVANATSQHSERENAQPFQGNRPVRLACRQHIWVGDDAEREAGDPGTMGCVRLLRRRNFVPTWNCWRLLG